jgi:hypothetical protein
MGSSRDRPRKPRKKLPPIPKYVRPPNAGRYWKLGGPLTADHEAEALAAERAKKPSWLGRWVLKKLGGSPPP